MKWRRVEPGVYVTDDGRYEVTHSRYGWDASGRGCVTASYSTKREAQQECQRAARER